MTPKKGTLAKADPDLSALHAERDELKRQVLLKRECSERLKVNKEIQELKKELASLDSPQATGGAPKVTIKDLRKMNSLKSVVDSNLEPTYFDDEDNEDSQEEISETKSSHKTRKIKSGKAAKSSEISVKTPQHWPHSFVPGQISDHKDTEYKDLTMTQFVAGYCSIIVHLISRHENLTAQSEIVHRLRHLKSLMCFAYSYPWECILDIHHEVLVELERGNRKWGDNFSDIESLNLLLQRKSKTSKTDKKKYWFCASYQRGSCTKKSPHSAVIGNERKMVRHICATCYLKDKIASEHPETSDECPHRND